MKLRRWLIFNLLCRASLILAIVVAVAWGRSLFGDEFIGMISVMDEKIVELDLGCYPEAGVSGAMLLQNEYRAFLTFNAMKPTHCKSSSGEPYRADAGVAVVEFKGCTITKFGYPNDEAWHGIPRTHGLSYGIYEVLNSRWKQEIVAMNRGPFPKTIDWKGRHFLFLFHDSSFECIAQEMKLELCPRPYANVFERIAQKLLSD